MLTSSPPRAPPLDRVSFSGWTMVLLTAVRASAEARELALGAVALQHVGSRDRLAADLVGDGALDDRPVDAPLTALVLDILEPAVDDRVDVVELALRRPPRIVAAAPVAPVTPAGVAVSPVPLWPAAIPPVLAVARARPGLTWRGATPGLARSALSRGPLTGPAGTPPRAAVPSLLALGTGVAGRGGRTRLAAGPGRRTRSAAAPAPRARSGRPLALRRTFLGGSTLHRSALDRSAFSGSHCRSLLSLAARCRRAGWARATTPGPPVAQAQDWSRRSLGSGPVAFCLALGSGHLAAVGHRRSRLVPTRRAALRGTRNGRLTRPPPPATAPPRRTRRLSRSGIAAGRGISRHRHGRSRCRFRRRPARIRRLALQGPISPVTKRFYRRPGAKGSAGASQPARMAGPHPGIGRRSEKLGPRQETPGEWQVRENRLLLLHYFTF